MWPFDYFKKKREKEEQKHKREEEETRRQKIEEERTAREREKRLEESRRKETERQLNMKTKEGLSIKPFVFKSNSHQRYENTSPKMGLQECARTISVEKNINGCKGYNIEPGCGYIVKIFNDDLGKPNMSDKPMKVVRKTETTVELRGYLIEAMSPFGWQEVDYSVYGLIVYYEHDKVSKCVLHMYDRDIRIEYLTRLTTKNPHGTINTNKLNNNISVRDVAAGNPFNIKFTSIQVVKQPYNGQSENMDISTSVITTVSRSTIDGMVKFDIGSIEELSKNEILQLNPLLNPSFYYNEDEKGNEFATAEVGNTITATRSGNEYISLFQVTRQNGKLIAFIINNLPNEEDFYYLIIFKE